MNTSLDKRCTFTCTCPSFHATRDHCALSYLPFLSFPLSFLWFPQVASVVAGLGEKGIESDDLQDFSTRRVRMATCRFGAQFTVGAEVCADRLLGSLLGVWSPNRRVALKDARSSCSVVGRKKGISVVLGRGFIIRAAAFYKSGKHQRTANC